MTTKVELADRIIAEFADIQERPDLPRGRDTPFPILIPTGDGRSIAISDQIADDIRAFGKIVLGSLPDAATSLSSEDMDEMTRRAFGAHLSPLDLSSPAVGNRELLLAGVEAFFAESVSSARMDRTFVFGCWFVRDFTPPVEIGPVRIEPRNVWIDRLHAENKISEITKRRIEKTWQGKKPQRRKPTRDAMLEDALVDSIENCPDVCTVETRGLAGRLAGQKAMLAARLALTATSLLWREPSKALQGLGLHIDGGWHRRRYVMFGNQGGFGSSSNVIRAPGRTWVTEGGWAALWQGSTWLMGPIGEALGSFLSPGAPCARPNLARVVFLALWWFHEGCKAETPLMSTVKFAAVLDTLAGGKECSINQLIEARLGKGKDDPLTRDGRKTSSVVKEIYKEGRSRTLHGSTDRHGHDWTNTSATAESLARLCLVESINWLYENPSVDDLSQLLVPTS